jgi:BlaI family transcriptional regulator, penicillinase repressor
MKSARITINRMEEKKIVRRTRKVGNFHLFEPLISRDAAQLRLIDELVAMTADAPSWS